jgi:N-acetylmuramoyl-L-alanine amidase
MFKMAKSAKEYIIALSDGHGMQTAGKRTPIFPEGSGIKSSTGNFMHENEFNRAVINYLKIELERTGFQTLLVAPTDADTSLVTRTNLANSRGADLYMSVHANANISQWGTWGGIETFAMPKGEGLRIAKIIHKHLMEGTEFRDRGVKDGSHLWEIRKTQMPAVLAECGFMDNLNEAKHLLNDAYRRECAREIAQGISEAFGVKYVAAPKADKAPDDTKSDDKAIGTIRVLVDDLYYYNKPLWDAHAGQVDKGTVLTVMEELTVNGSKMYRLKSGTYITAYNGYVEFSKA